MVYCYQTCLLVKLLYLISSGHLEQNLNRKLLYLISSGHLEQAFLLINNIVLNYFVQNISMTIFKIFKVISELQLLVFWLKILMSLLLHINRQLSKRVDQFTQLVKFTSKLVKLVKFLMLERMHMSVSPFPYNHSLKKIYWFEKQEMV